MKDKFKINFINIFGLKYWPLSRTDRLFVFGAIISIPSLCAFLTIKNISLAIQLVLYLGPFICAVATIWEIIIFINAFRENGLIKSIITELGVISGIISIAIARQVINLVTSLNPNNYPWATTALAIPIGIFISIYIGITLASLFLFLSSLYASLAIVINIIYISIIRDIPKISNYLRNRYLIRFLLKIPRKREIFHEISLKTFLLRFLFRSILSNAGLFFGLLFMLTIVSNISVVTYLSDHKASINSNLTTIIKYTEYYQKDYKCTNNNISKEEYIKVIDENIISVAIPNPPYGYYFQVRECNNSIP